MTSPQPAADPDRCCGCGRALDGNDVQVTDGRCCPRCRDLTAAERELHRRARALPADQLPMYLGRLSDDDLSATFRAVGAGPRHRQELRQAVDRALRRRQKARAIPADSFRSQRRPLARNVQRRVTDGTTSDRLHAAWLSVNDALRPNRGAAELVEHPDMRAVLDRLDHAALADLHRLAGAVRDHVVSAVVITEQRRRRTAPASIGGGDDAA